MLTTPPPSPLPEYREGEKRQLGRSEATYLTTYQKPSQGEGEQDRNRGNKRKSYFSSDSPRIGAVEAHTDAHQKYAQCVECQQRAHYKYQVHRVNGGRDNGSRDG